MKNFALVVALALFALTVPASAAEISSPESSKAAPAMTLEQQIEGTVPPALELIGPVFWPRCADVHGTSCTSLGSKKACTDVCSNQLSCTCTNYYSSGLRWRCNQEC
jgi:hypothetical protein